MRNVCRNVVALVATVAIASATLGESTPAAVEWLDRLETVYDSGPFNVKYETEVNTLRGGRTTSVRTRGQATQAGRHRFRIETWMETSTPETESSNNLHMLGTSDGEVIWLETNDAETSRRQVFRMPIEQLEKRAGFNPIARGLSRMDPVSQVRLLTTMFDFEVVERSDAFVTLGAEVTGETLARVQRSFAGDDPSQLENLFMTFDTATGFPREIRFGSDPPVMWIRFEEFERLDAVEDAVFRYAPPGDVEVVDLEDYPEPGSTRTEQPEP